jgi:hypothetical protein
MEPNKPNTTTPDFDPASAALNWLQQHENGVILRQLGEELLKTALAVEKHPGAKSVGHIVLKITLERIENKPLLEVGHEIATKVPKPPASTALFWTDGTGRLHANNPRQRTLGFGGELGDFTITAPNTPLPGSERSAANS